jgi:NAD(P)-dependent dehydrogenase (short-subunit alcohol dehydrogenase family)
MAVSLSGQRLLVIGGSSGIGEAVARLAAQGGAQVTIAARNAERLQNALRRLPEGVSAAPLDMEDALAVRDFFARHDPWDHVVIAGSSTKSGSVSGLDLQDAKAAMHNKFWGAYHVAHSAGIAAEGSLTLVSGVYSQRPVVSAVLQGAINAALEALMRGLALEFAPRQIRVNAVSPSTTVTPLWDRLGPEGRQQKFDTMAARLPVGRVAAADDIAEAILLAATNRFMTGSTLLVDGGDSLV